MRCCAPAVRSAAADADTCVDVQTRSGHDQVTKQVKISELKAKLSAYLASVRAGDTVVVCDRSTPIARLVPLEEAGDDDLQIQPARGRIPGLGQLPRVRLRRKVDVVAMLR